MQTWEYIALHLESDKEKIKVEESSKRKIADVIKRVWNDDNSKYSSYSPFALTPLLDALGADGWEMVSMQPLVVGSNADVTLPVSSAAVSTIPHWTHHYLCVFKRPVPPS